MLLIDAIAIVETADKNVSGDHGAALSPFQIHRAAWNDVKKYFGNPAQEIYLNIGERFEDISSSNPDLRMFARNAATGYSFILADRLKRDGQPATPENIYACWNLGFQKFRRRGFELARCPLPTIHNARRVAELVNAPDPPVKHQVKD